MCLHPLPFRQTSSRPGLGRAIHNRWSNMGQEMHLRPFQIHPRWLPFRASFVALSDDKSQNKSVTEDIDSKITWLQNNFQDKKNMQIVLDLHYHMQGKVNSELRAQCRKCPPLEINDQCQGCLNRHLFRHPCCLKCWGRSARHEYMAII